MGSLPGSGGIIASAPVYPKTHSDYAAVVVTGTIPRHLALESAAEYYARDR